LLDRDEKKGNNIAGELGASALFAKVDVTSDSDIKAAIEAGVKAFGDIHGVVNCAGVGIAVKTMGKTVHPLQSFQTVIQINLVGTFNVSRLVVERMAKQNPVTPDGERGVIINVASVAAFDGQNGQVAYSASKGGIVGMTLPMSRDLGPFGIRVMTIAPGTFETPLMSAATDPTKKSLISQAVFPKRFGNPIEFAHLCKTIVENSFLNGEVIRLDAGIRMPKL